MAKPLSRQFSTEVCIVCDYFLQRKQKLMLNGEWEVHMCLLNLNRKGRNLPRYFFILYIPRNHQHPSHSVWISSISFFIPKKILFYVSLHVHRSSENDLTFHFFGAENDSNKVRESINRMVEKGRIGNFSLVSTHYALHQEPGLVLQVRRFIIFLLVGD